MEQSYAFLWPRTPAVFGFTQSLQYENHPDFSEYQPFLVIYTNK